jgi:hypothetical protein
VQEFPLGDVILNVGLGFVHSNHERKFAKANWATEKLARHEQGGGKDQYSIISGAFHNLRVLPRSV